VERQLRRYFVGVITFGFVVTWIGVGALAAFLGLLAASASMLLPGILEARRARRRPVRRRAADGRPSRSVTTRPLADEPAEELPLVPDEPSLIIGISS
jgi:hypothetical protein